MPKTEKEYVFANAEKRNENKRHHARNFSNNYESFLEETDNNEAFVR